MKLQHLAIMFVLIIIPISMVMSSYIQNQIDAIALQTQFDTTLISATYDAVKAFQINTTNNKYSSISDSKIRDIEAAVNTFYNTLNNSMASYALYRSDLEAYIPAILFTLYDGYYIYSSYDNVYSETDEGKISLDLDGNNYQNGLRPYVYYSAKYNLPITGNSSNVIVVNYTLDNAITVYGDVGDGEGYSTKSGYLINPNDVSNINDTAKTLTYKGVSIEPETLTEHLITIEDDITKATKEGDYNYIFYQNEKVYQDKDDNGDLLYYDEDGNMTTDSNITGIPVIFWYDSYMKSYINSPTIRAYAQECGMKSYSAYEYYKEAKEFSEWVDRYLGGITQSDMLRIEDGVTPVSNNIDGYDEDGNIVYYLAENTGDNAIFDFNNSDNDPMLSSSTFNTHRLAVIRKSIETNLNTVISNYHSISSYDYALPVFSDDDWYKILNNVSVVTFLQGISIGYRIYNNYAIITNNVNKEVVKSENIYIIARDSSNNYEYHQPGCEELLEGVNSRSLTIVQAYSTSTFARQSVKLSDSGDDNVHYYLHASTDYTLTGCYNCIVNATAEFDVDDIIEGINLIKFEDEIENGGTGTVSFSTSQYATVRKIYLTALARERNDLYKSNFDLSDY